jgi:hypothetical protein
MLQNYSFWNRKRRKYSFSVRELTSFIQNQSLHTIKHHNASDESPVKIVALIFAFFRECDWRKQAAIAAFVIF